MSWAWTRTFYAKSEDGKVYNFEAKRQRDTAVRRLGFVKLTAHDAEKTQKIRVGYHDFDEWLRRAER